MVSLNPEPPSLVVFTGSGTATVFGMTVRRLQPFTSTIFSEVSQLAARHQAINLGQGFPDTDGPSDMLAAAAEALRSGHNQYPPGQGVPELRTAVTDHIAAYTGLNYDPDSEVLITVGATEAIAGALLGLVEYDDEVVVIEPYYDSYAAIIALSGAQRRTARLVRSGTGFRLDLDSLRAAFSSRTRAVLVNSPHNPTGAVLPREDLAEIARLCQEYDALAISDEVYEHLIFDGHAHLSIASLPGMSERTIRISSAAKTFNCTGWKVGWLTGPEHLVAGARAAKQYLSYAAGTPLQLGVAHALRYEMDWVSGLRDELQLRRDQLAGALVDAGFKIAHTEGTYFIAADPRRVADGGPQREADSDVTGWCLQLPERIGVAAVPFSPFVDDVPTWSNLVRFAFCKRGEVIEEAARRLGRLREGS